MMELTLFKTAYDPELEDIAQEREQQATTLVESLTGIMIQGIQIGLLRPDLDPIQAARTFAAFQQGILFLWLSNPKAFSIKKEASALADTFLKGLISKQ